MILNSKKLLAAVCCCGLFVSTLAGSAEARGFASFGGVRRGYHRFATARVQGRGTSTSHTQSSNPASAGK